MGREPLRDREGQVGTAHGAFDGTRRLKMGKHDEPPRHRIGHADTEFAFHHERTSQISLPTP